MKREPSIILKFHHLFKALYSYKVYYEKESELTKKRSLFTVLVNVDILVDCSFIFLIKAESKILIC